MSNPEERAAYLEAKPDERTPDHLVDLILEAELVKAARPFLSSAYTADHANAFELRQSALEQAAHGNGDARGYLDLVGIDRIWVMTDGLAELEG